MGEQKEYFLKIGKQVVSVNEEVYKAYYIMLRREKYLLEMDQEHGLLYYNSWDSDSTNGCDYIADQYQNTEDDALRNIEQKELWEFVQKSGDKYNICCLVSLGFTEREISAITGISHTAVNKNKKRLFAKIKLMLQ